MRFHFHTRYEQDLRIFRDRRTAAWYAALLALVLLAPWLVSDYVRTQLAFVFVMSIVGFGLMLLVGFTGQISMGHAAFFAIGAYTEAILQAGGWPAPVSLPAAIVAAAGAGVVVGLPALRLSGIYLAIATLSFGFIVEEVLARWESMTGGNSGMTVTSMTLLPGLPVGQAGLYFVALGCVTAVGFMLRNLLRSPTGRAFIAVRDSEISAQSMGVNLARTKTLSFALSAGITGLGGALYAHQIQFLSPDQFTLLVSIEFLMMIVIGGMGSLHGAVLGAVFVIGLPQAIAIAKDWLPAAIGAQPGLKPALFGGVMIAFLLFEPLGLYGRWLKTRTWFSLFPLYRRHTFRRQKSYMKSERVR